MTKPDLETWRIADRLSLVDAAILITGNNPSDHYFDNDQDRVQITWQHDGYDTAFKALKNAILQNRLQAQFAFPLQEKGLGAPGSAVLGLRK